jgi:hypothetical protein
MKTLTLTVLAGLGVMLAPGISGAATVGSWLKGCQTGIAANSLAANGWACWTPSGSVEEFDDAPLLAMDNCENVDLIFFPDYLAAGTDSTTTYDVLICPSPSVADGDVDDACELMTGIVAGETNVSGGGTVGWLRIDSNDDGANAENGQFQVKCNP